MAASGLWSFLKESAKQIVKDVPADALALWGYHKLFGRVKGKLDDPGLGVDLRGQVESDMVTIERKIGRQLANIREWHKQANEDHFPYSENDFMMLLAKIPRGRRAGVYVTWDGLTRAEFIQRFDAVNHDFVTQKTKRAWRFVYPYVVSGWSEVKTRSGAVGTWMESQIQITSSRPLRINHPFLRILAWGIGIPVAAGLIALVAVFFLASKGG